MESGVLFEINRQVLHPLGLSMEIVIDYDKVNGIKFGKLVDGMGDPEGITYSSESFADGMEKFRDFMEHYGNRRIETRIETLGYRVQNK